MPFTYQIDPERELAVIKATGTMTAEDLIDMVRALAADERWSPSYSRLVDGTDLDEFVLELDQLKQFIAEVREERKGARKTAVVVTTEFRALGVKTSEMFLRKDYPVRAFRTVEAAMGWLEEE